MFQIIRNWLDRRIVERSTITPSRWSAAFAALPLLDGLVEDEKRRLRELAILFLNRKAIEGAHELTVTQSMALIIALQACLPILELGLDGYEGWTSVIVYPSGFAPERVVMDEYGVEHRVRDELAGEAWQRGPVILAWDETEQAGHIDGNNLVIHEFAHKLDMQNGEANGFPPLHRDMDPVAWTRAFSAGFEDFQQRCRVGEHIGISCYGASSPAEYFAVLSEVFFERPDLLRRHYVDVYEQMRQFYRQDRLSLLVGNGWQGLLLATLVLFLFFSWRYTFWVALGLPISFVGGLMVMSLLGVTINMISMVALLMAIGILMDDAIVISESIENEFHNGKPPLEAAVAGIGKVGRGVLSSFATSAMLFGSLLFLKGDMGQVMGVLPVVLLSVLTISLVEAFLILPHHLAHSLQHHAEREKPAWRQRFEERFDQLRARTGELADLAIRYRYLTVGSAIGLFVITISLFPAGLVKFKAFPDLEGNVLEARIIMPQGTPFDRTEAVIAQLLANLQQALQQLPPEAEGELVKHVQVFYSNNSDAGEEGPHLATISLDLLDSERRQTSLNELRRQWQSAAGQIVDAVSVQFKEPQLGPAGQAISIRLQHDDLQQLSNASWELQTWLTGYPGVSNIMDDLRLGKPQFTASLHPGALASGLSAAARAAIARRLPGRQGR